MQYILIICLIIPQNSFLAKVETLSFRSRPDGGVDLRKRKRKGHHLLLFVGSETSRQRQEKGGDLFLEIHPTDKARSNTERRLWPKRCARPSIQPETMLISKKKVNTRNFSLAFEIAPARDMLKYFRGARTY